MEVEPWEALDLDDSDLPSLLRPCKRRRSTSPTTTAAAAAANPLPQSTSTESPEQHCPEQLQRQPPPCTSRRRTIPGLAGIVQSAMLRKVLNRENRNCSSYQKDSGEDLNGNYNCDGVLTTQDYIRRAMVDTADFDDDFTRQPWIPALQFLGAQVGVVKSTPISSIKKCLNGGKVVQVIAVIKSCTPNGLGGLIVSLKDPTGTVGASIHHKVFSGSEFGKNLTIGSVLILQEVAIFAPARSAYYLNITLRNLVKVFCQNGASTSKLSDSAYPIQYADRWVENCEKSRTMEKMSTVQNVTMEDIEKTQHPREAENLQNHSVIKQDLFSRSVQSTERASTTISESQRELINLSQDVCNEIPEDTNRTGIIGDDQVFVEGGNLEDKIIDTNNVKESVMKNSGQEVQGTNAVRMQSQHLKSKVSMPQWTDEQLDELFAGDDE